MSEHLSVAIVHDYLTQRGGAERVALSMLDAFPEAPIYTALYNETGTYPEFAFRDVRPMWPNRFGLLRRDHRRGLLLFPWVFSRLVVDADVVVCSSSGYAHGAKTNGRKVVYCYTPPRWLYDEADTYLSRWPRIVAVVVKAAGPVLRRWDRRAARTADTYLTSSRAVRDRIAETYGIEAEVVPPSARRRAIGTSAPLPGINPGFVLCVSRLMAYKNVGAVCAAFEQLPDQRLVVVGEGPEARRLRDTAPSNVLLVGRVGDPQLSWLYENSAGVASASYEDFGLTVLEAGAYGKPVVALRAGGFLDTVVEGVTGIFFDSPTGPEVAEAITRMLETPWDRSAVEDWAGRFSEAAFAERLKQVVQEVVATV